MTNFGASQGDKVKPIGSIVWDGEQSASIQIPRALHQPVNTITRRQGVRQRATNDPAGEEEISRGARVDQSPHDAFAGAVARRVQREDNERRALPGEAGGQQGREERADDER